MVSVCAVEDCDRSATHADRGRRGWCVMHYARWLKHGDPLKVLPAIRQTLAERFWAKVARADIGCWPWLGSTDRNGYGSIRVGGRKGGMIKVHRLSYELEVETIPLGLEIDHLCSHRGCVRPDHLEVVDRTENNQRRWFGLDQGAIA